MTASPATSTPSGSASARAAAVTLQGVVKRYGDVDAVAGIDLEIADGEFFSMLGPSGSGKTTTLRMIAGFETPSEGRILLHGREVTGVPWILHAIKRPNELPVVNIVALVLIALSVIPVYLAQRVSGEAAGVTR